MANISQNVNIEMLEKLPDGTYKRKYPKTTKEQVGLDEVDNVKQMPISDGVLENYTERLDASDNEIDVGSSSVWIFHPSRNATLEFVNTPQKADVAASVTVIVKTLFEINPIIFPPSVKWQGGEVPDLSTASKTYVLTFMTVDGGTTWLGMFGGEF